MVDIINYRNGKALVIDTVDLLALNRRTIDPEQDKIWTMIETARHNTDYILIITNSKVASFPLKLRERFNSMDFDIVPCYRFMGEEKDEE